MMNRFVVVIGFLLIFTSIAFANTNWYNDTSTNDTCLVIYSDNDNYSSINGIISGQLKIVNNCGTEYINKTLEFYDSGAANTLKADKITATTLVKNPKEISKITYKNIEIWVDPIKVKEDMIYKYDGNEYKLTVDQYKQLTFVDVNGQVNPVYIYVQVKENNTLNLNAVSSIVLDKIPVGDTIIPFEFKVLPNSKGEFGFNIEGMSFLDPVYDTGLVGYWSLDESSGLAQDGVGTYHALGQSGIVYDTVGKIGRDFNFAAGATKSFVSIGKNAVFSAQTFSVCGWVWTNATAAQVLISRKDSNTKRDSFSLESDAGGLWYFIHHNTDGIQKYAVTGGAISANAWHFFCGSRDTARLYIWVDNVMYTGATSTYTGSVYQGIDVNFSFGANSDLSQLFNGRLDEISYFDRNLTATDVNELWNGGAGLAYSTLTVTITKPTIGGTVLSGFSDVNFNVTSVDNHIDMNIYVSSSPGTYKRLIYRDTDLSDGVGVTCTGYNFATIQSCKYTINSSELIDDIYGTTYYFDINSHIATGSITKTTSSSFFVARNSIAPDSYGSGSVTVGTTAISGFETIGGFIQGTGTIVGGTVATSSDINFGRHWGAVTSDRNNIAALCVSSDGYKIYAPISGGKILDSSNTGSTWRLDGAVSTTWNSISCSYDGKYALATAEASALTYNTNDYGVTWSSVLAAEISQDSAMSINGKYQAVAAGSIFLSSDYGVTWAAASVVGNFFGITMSKDGNYLVATTTGAAGKVYKSSNAGITWTESSSAGVANWKQPSMSETGKYVIIGSYSSKIIYSSNYGVSWNVSSTTPLGNIYGSAISYNGQNSIMNVLDQNIMASHTYGNDFNIFGWKAYWTGAAISDNGYSFVAQALNGTNDGFIYMEWRQKRGIDNTTCEYTDNNGISWNNADWNNITESCEITNITIIPGQTYTFNTRIRDFNGTFGYGTATRLYTPAVGTAVTIYVQDQSSNPISNVDLNIFTISGGVRTFYLSTHSDVTGTALAFLNIGDVYGLDVKQNGVLLKTTNDLLVSSSPIYITIPTSTTGLVSPDVNQIYVTWTPSSDFIYSDILSIIQNINSKNVTDFNLLIYQLNDLNSNLKKNIYSVAGPCNKVCTITTLLAGFSVDTNKPFYVDLNLGMQNHIERYITSHKYIKNPTLFDSIRNVRSDFGCSTDTSLPCGALMIISIIITIFVVGAIVMMTGYAGPSAIAIIVLALLGISTYIGWFYWIPYLIMVLAVVFWLGKGVVE